jgi:hypothetical protein
MRSMAVFTEETLYVRLCVLASGTSALACDEARVFTSVHGINVRVYN